MAEHGEDSKTNVYRHQKKSATKPFALIADDDNYFFVYAYFFKTATGRNPTKGDGCPLRFGNSSSASICV